MINYNNFLKFTYKLTKFMVMDLCMIDESNKLQKPNHIRRQREERGEILLMTFSMTLHTASRTAAISKPTSTWDTQKAFPSDAASSAISLATLTAFCKFCSAIFFCAFLTLFCWVGIKVGKDTLIQNTTRATHQRKDKAIEQKKINKITWSWTILSLISAFLAAGICAASMRDLKEAIFC